MFKPVLNRIDRTYRKQQRGAIAVMTGLLMLLVLVPVAGLVLDLGHLYIVKSELQNLADASALAAAKDLDNSTAGVNKAVATGKALALKNRYDFGSTMTLQDANFRFGPTPDGPWYSVADTQTNPAGRSFVEVDTRSGGSGTSINTYLMRVAGRNTTETYGSAVAGRYTNTVTPIGICAVDPTTRSASYNYGTFTELVEYGFRRGVTYNVFELGSLGGATSDPYQINPINSPPGACNAGNSSANITAPFMCVGNSAVLPTGVGQVYTNTGMTSSLDKALNSRFNDYSGGSQCDPSSAPPDVNVKEYPCKAGGTDCVNNNSNNIATTPPINWMETGLNNLPSQMGISTVTSGTLSTPRYAMPAEASAASSATKIWPTVSAAAGVARLPSGSAPFANYGPLWSYGRPVQSNGSTLITPAQANGTIGTNVVGTDKLMYGQVGAGVTDYLTEANYPTSVGTGFSASDPPSPYNQTGNSNYFVAPTGRTGVADRRILNIVLIDCRTPPVGSGACGVMNVVGIGKFFMQKKADFSGSPKKLFVEFTGLVEPVPSSEVKLYK
ncbi:pilus assembly protein TadG-related protein [Pseudoduganella sp.]|uniref:pilus assembly protein TadG-related protein n=1 Tax=Pseudoduganella sp. TaxID=1880898 RepID=UPI0035B30F7A